MVTLDPATLKKVTAAAAASGRTLSGMLSFVIRKHFGTLK